MDKSLGRYKLTDFTLEETEDLNNPVTSDGTELVIKKLPKNKSPGPNGFTAIKHLKK